MTHRSTSGSGNLRVHQTVHNEFLKWMNREIEEMLRELDREMAGESSFWRPASPARRASTLSATSSGPTEELLKGMDAAAEETLRSNSLSMKSGANVGPENPLLTSMRKKGTRLLPTSRASLGRRR